MPAPVLDAHAPVLVAAGKHHLGYIVDLKNLLKMKSTRTPVVKPPTTGVYHFLRETSEEKSRIHLRIDPDGCGTLIINANRIFHFNPTAATMAYYNLNRFPTESAVKEICRSYQITKSAAAKDYSAFSDQLDQLVRTDVCPICDLEVETTAPFSTRPTAPYRMDLAITYRCNNDCAHCYNGRPRQYPELSTAEWFKVLDHLWDLGIPHIVFTGGEPTLRDDLPQLIHHAEQNGQITGLNTNGRKLKNKSYLQSLIDAGLDHVQITLESHIPEIHDEMVRHPGAWVETVEGIRNSVSSRLYVMTNTTILQNNSPHMADTLEFLAGLGLKTVGLNALIYSGRGKNVGTGIQETDLQKLLITAQSITALHNQRLIWYTPTQYCHFDPETLSLGVKGCTAALYNMCVEPDGSVIPCQSYYHSLGNILTSEWNSIWNHDLSVSLRERKLAPSKCSGCSFFSECGGGCPLASS